MPLPPFVGVAMIGVVAAACHRKADPPRADPEARAGVAVTVLEPGVDPQPVAQRVGPFTPVTMLIVIESTETVHEGARAPTVSPLTTETMDFTVTRTSGDATEATFEVALGAVFVSPDTTKNMAGWPMVVKRGAAGEVREMTAPSIRTDATSLEEGIGRYVRMMFVPIPSEPIGKGARWQVEQRVGSVAEFTTFQLLERRADALVVSISITASSDAIDAAWSTTFDGKLDVPLAPWQPARGAGTVTTHLDYTMLAGRRVLDQQGRVTIGVKSSR